MTRKGIRVHTNVAPGSPRGEVGNKNFTARGGQVLCRDGFLLLKGTVLADQTSPCPFCNSTAAANMAAWRAFLSWIVPELPSGRRLIETPKVPSRVNRSDADLPEIDTTGFSVIKVAEGVVPRRNREGGLIRKQGHVVMDTIDFRSDAAVKRRLAGGMSKWGKGNVTGSTSVCTTWAVPAHPTRDSMANSKDISADLRSGHMADTKTKQRKTPRKGAHQKPKTIVVRRYTV